MPAVQPSTDDTMIRQAVWARRTVTDGPAELSASWAGLRHGLGKLEGLARNPLDAEDFSLLGHPVNGGTATMQVDSDILSHRASSSFEASFLQVRACSDLTRGRRPRPFIASDVWLCQSVVGVRIRSAL